MPKSSVLPMCVLIDFQIQLMNGGLFLRANFCSYALLFGSATVIFSLTTIYALL